MSPHHWNSWVKSLTCGLSVNIFGKSGNAKTWVTDSCFSQSVLHYKSAGRIACFEFISAYNHKASKFTGSWTYSICKVRCQLVEFKTV